MRLIPVMLPLPEVGTRVVVNGLDRLPSFEFTRHLPGAVVEVQMGEDDFTVRCIVVKLDEHLEFLDQWDNCVVWQWEHAFGNPNAIPANVLYDFWQNCSLETSEHYQPDYDRLPG